MPTATPASQNLVAGLSSRLAAFVVRHPRAVLLSALLLAIVSTPLVLRLRLDTNMTDLLPRQTPAAESFARFTRAFGSEQILVIVVESDDGARLTAFADEYAKALGAIPGIKDVRFRLSAASAVHLRDHLLDLLDDAELQKLAERTTPDALDRQARRLRSLLAAPGGSALAPILTADPLDLLSLVGARLQAGLPVDPRSGYYKSPDGKALLLFVQPDSSPFDIERDRVLLGAASRAAEALGAKLGLPPPGSNETIGAAPRVGYTGAYAYALAYRDFLHRDMQLSTVVSSVAVLLFFALLLGALRALPVVAPPLLLGLWVTAAAAVAIYGRINAVSLAFGTILVSIGIDIPIQLYNRLREELDRHPPRDAVQRTMASLGAPSLLATLGPVVVFFACSFSRYKGLGELGLLAGVGLLINLAMMLTVLPALLVVLPARWWMPRGQVRASGQWFSMLGEAAARRPRWVLAAMVLLGACAVPAATKLHFERRLISMEPEALAPAQVRRELERRFGGRENLLVVVSDGATREEALEKSDRWRDRAEALREQGLLAATESVSSLFPSQAEIARRRAVLDRQGRARIADGLRAALAKAGFDTAPFSGFLDQLVHPPAPLRLEQAGPELSFLVRAHVQPLDGRTLVTTYLYPAPGKLDVALAAAAALTEAHPEDGQLTGQPLLEDALRDVVQRDTVRVTAVAVLLVVLLLALYYRRLRPVLAVLLPLSLAWALFAAALGLFDLPLNLFNLLTVPLIVGYGIDDHVFLVHRFEELHDEALRDGPDPSGSSLGRALASTGRAIVVTSLSTMAGFAGLAFARFDGLRLLGVTGTLAIGLCLFAALAVLPPLLAVLYPRRAAVPRSAAQG